MIFVTGDIHGDPERFNTDYFADQLELSRDDYMIICGDFGLLWDEEENPMERVLLNWLEDKNYTTLFIDGNHENFDRLNKIQVEEWHGGHVHKVRDHVIHLMRGEIFDLNGKSVYAFGGARSHDINGLATSTALKRDYTAGILQKDDPRLEEKLKILDITYRHTRIEGKTWWRAEMPTRDEMDRGLKNLSNHDNKVDMIISHDGPSSDVAVLGGGFLRLDPLNRYLEIVKRTAKYENWYFGHHHENQQIAANDYVIYENIERIY